MGKLTTRRKLASTIATVKEKHESPKYKKLVCLLYLYTETKYSPIIRFKIKERLITVGKCSIGKGTFIIK
ncbi:hypothetical protein PES01_07700 [Pseudoalteromonas espejiana]|uniref:Uncharacterized protein n=1 Tax=Pseudoalteromonas espejiana TaxID=28107 RepID=A0A510XSE5_9GAMM|nr:hypothetical protein PES01_07700 [Pseudoalteromonas espejiana]